MIARHRCWMRLSSFVFTTQFSSQQPTNLSLSTAEPSLSSKLHNQSTIKIQMNLVLFSCWADWAIRALLKVYEHLSFHMKYLDLHLKDNLIRQTSFLPKNLPGHSGLRGLKEPENPDLNYWQLTVWIVHWLLDTKVKVICSRVQLTPSFCVWLSYYSLFHLWQILLGLTLIHFNSAENLICQSSAYPSALYFFQNKVHQIWIHFFKFEICRLDVEKLKFQV